MEKVVSKDRKVKFHVHTDDGSKDIVVSTSRLLSSSFFSNMLDLCSDTIVLPYPKQFNDVVDCYINYLVCGIVEPTTVNRCLQLCHYLDDSNYLSVIVSSLLGRYDNNIDKFHSVTNDLIDNLQQDIYLLCPFCFIPKLYILNKDFVNRWLSLNKNKTFTIYDYLYTVSVDYYKDNSVNKVTPYKLCHSLYNHDEDEECPFASTKMLHGACCTWSQNGHIELFGLHRDDELNGTCYIWYPDTNQLRSETEYYNGKRLGVSRGWLSTGSLFCETHYRFDIKHGTCKCWNESGKLVYHSCYHDGQKLTTDIQQTSND